MPITFPAMVIDREDQVFKAVSRSENYLAYAASRNAPTSDFRSAAFGLISQNRLA